MGWDFFQYEAQPDYFLDQLWVKWQLEAEKSQQDQNKSKQGNTSLLKKR